MSSQVTEFGCAVILNKGFLITEVRNEIHSLQIFHMTPKDCIYTSITSRSRDCRNIVHQEASFNVT